MTNSLPQNKKLLQRRGFSLIEVCIALLVAGVGYLALLQILPHGLRQSTQATEASAQSIFAQTVFSAMRAGAAELDTWSDWEDNWSNANSKFSRTVDYKFKFDEPALVTDMLQGVQDKASFGVTSYLLLTKRDANNRIFRVTLWSTSHDISKITDANLKERIVKGGPAFYTEFVFQGK